MVRHGEEEKVYGEAASMQWMVTVNQGLMFRERHCEEDALKGQQKTERQYYIKRIMSPVAQRAINRRREKDGVKAEYLKENNADI